MQVPAARSQTLRVVSKEAETAWRPSGARATVVTEPLCPSRAVDAGARGQIPDLEGLIIGGRDGVAAVGSEGHGLDPVSVSLQGVDAGA